MCTFNLGPCAFKAGAVSAAPSSKPCIWAQCYIVSILKVNLIVGANQIFPEWIENEECALSCLLKSQEIFPEVQSPRVPMIAKGDGVNQRTSLKFLSFFPSVKTYRSEARKKCPCCGKDPISQWFDFPLCTGNAAAEIELPFILREKLNSTTYHPPPQGQGSELTKANLALGSPNHSLCSTSLFWLSLPSEPLGTARDHCRQPINAVFKATHPFLMDSPLIWGLGHEFECCALNTSSTRHPGFASG